jgi:acyl dehydratase
VTAVQPEAAAEASGAPMWFEDFRVGQRFASAERTISAADIAGFAELSGDRSLIHFDDAHARSLGFPGPLAHGPFGIAVAFGLLYDLGIVETTAIAMRDLTWRFIAPVVAGDAVRLELVVTRCRRHPTRDAGTVSRHLRLAARDGAVVQEGTSAMLVQARGPATDGDRSVSTDFCSAPWARVLAPALEANDAFREATRTFDGAIGLRAGDDEVHLRIYKSRVLETARATPLGATFTLAGSELAWAELAFAERNDFIANTSRGAFSVSGSAYDYLRLTKALVAIWDEVRALAAAEGGR